MHQHGVCNPSQKAQLGWERVIPRDSSTPSQQGCHPELCRGCAQEAWVRVWEKAGSLVSPPRRQPQSEPV